MAGTKIATVTYVDQVLPGDGPVPVLWYFTIRDTEVVFGTEQTFTAPVPTVTFTGLVPGTGYTVVGGQRDATGAEMGASVTSPAFDVVADITVSFVGTLTITVG